MCYAVLEGLETSFGLTVNSSRVTARAKGAFLNTLWMLSCIKTVNNFTRFKLN
jgi:hypothetical protein